MISKKIKIKRESASEVMPKKLKPFNINEFFSLSRRLKKAIEKEEEKYGKIDSNSRLAV